MYFDYAQYKQKGSALLLLLILLVIIEIVLVIPVPSYNSGPCLMIVGAKCPGWVLGNPLWKRLISSSRLTPKPQPQNPVAISQTTKSTPSPADETANWKTYTNTQYKFEFKYPIDFTLLDHSEDYIPPYNLGTPIVIARKVGFKNAKAQYMQDVNFSISQSTNLSGCYDDYSGNEKITITDKQTLNGTEYYVTRARGAGAGHGIGGKVYRVIKGYLCFEVVAVNETEMGSGEGWYDTPLLQEQANKDSQKLQSELDQILSTFTFTVDETIGWKTYSNGDYGFSVKYPPLFSYKKQTLPPGDIFLFQINFATTKARKSNYNDGFSIEVTTPKTLAEEIEYRKWQVVGHSADKINKETDITKDGHKGVRLDYTILSSDPTLKKDFAIVIIKTGKYTYTIESNTDLIDQILSTLKFLK